MQISFSYNRSEVIRSISVVLDFVNQLQKTHSFYYFPFLEKTDIDAQISIDEAIYNPIGAFSRIQNLWNLLKDDVFTALEKYSDVYSEFKNIRDYKVILTFYGPYGYYEEPNILYINITQKNPEFWTETFLHELLHVVFIKRTSDFAFEETERFIDSAFVEVFGSIFPHYHAQNF